MLEGEYAIPWSVRRSQRIPFSCSRMDTQNQGRLKRSEYGQKISHVTCAVKIHTTALINHELISCNHLRMTTAKTRKSSPHAQAVNMVTHTFLGDNRAYRSLYDAIRV